MKRNNIIHGWGINDSPYNVSWYEYEDGQRVKKRCPLYMDWYDIIRRGFSDNLKNKFHTYRDVTVCEEWKYFTDYHNWVLNVQPNPDWVNCEPDKDILVSGNKIYSPDTTAYVSRRVNVFIIDSGAIRGDLPIGVHYSKRVGKYTAQCNNPFTKNPSDRHLGYFNTPEEAHLVWKAKKHEYACELSLYEKDPRVVQALQNKYKPI